MLEIQKTIALEGGYVDDPDDAGGETKYGISKRSHPDVDIKNLTIEQAEEIYKSNEWAKLHCDSYQNIQYRWKLFDIAVNQGMGTAQAFIPLVKQSDTIHGVYELVALQMKRYANRVVSVPLDLKFLRGWTNRAFETGDDLV